MVGVLLFVLVRRNVDVVAIPNIAVVAVGSLKGVVVLVSFCVVVVLVIE